MFTKGMKLMLSRMKMLSRTKLTDEAFAVVFTKDGKRRIIIDYFSQLNDKSVEGIFRVLRKPGGTSGGVSNTGVAVSEMSEGKLQGMIYYIKHFKRIGCTCTHAYF